MIVGVHQQCGRVPQLSAVRQKCGQTLDSLAQRVPAGDWKRAYIQTLANGFRGLAEADSRVTLTTREQRRAQRAEYLKTVEKVLVFVEQTAALAQDRAVLEHKGLLDVKKTTFPYLVTLGEMTMEINDVTAGVTGDVRTKVADLAARARPLLAAALATTTDPRHRRILEGAITAIGQLP
jgi:hypothetical protein